MLKEDLLSRPDGSELTDTQLPTGLSSRNRVFQAIVLVALGVLVGVAFLQAPGTGDTLRWLLYMDLARDHGVLATYDIAALQGVNGITTDYPPLAFLVLSLLHRLADLLGIGDFGALKASLIGFTLVCACIMAGWQNHWPPLLGIITFATLALNSFILGYIDVYFLPSFLISLILLKRGNFISGTALFALSIFIKWQPILLAPFIFFYIFPNWPKTIELIRVVPALLIVTVVYLTFGDAVVVAFIDGVAHGVAFSGQALNFNWLLSAIMENQLSGTDIGPVMTLRDGVNPVLGIGINPYLVMLSTVLRYLSFTICILYFYLSDRQFLTMLQATIAAFLCYFMFGYGVHESHLCVPAVLGLCWAASDHKRYFEATLLAVMFNINMMMFYGISGNQIGLGFSRIVGWDVTVFLTLFNFLVFAIIWFPIGAGVTLRLSRTAVRLFRHGRPLRHKVLPLNQGESVG